MAKIIKVVLAKISKDEIRYISLMSGPYAVDYWPGVWTRPILPGSLLFAFKDLQAAVAYYGIVNPATLPYIGKMFWYCEMLGPRRIWGIKSPSLDIMLRYWKLVSKGWSAKDDYENVIPRIYKFRDDIGAVAGTAINLVEPVLPEEMEQYKLFDLSYLDK